LRVTRKSETEPIIATPTKSEVIAGGFAYKEGEIAGLLDSFPNLLDLNQYLYLHIMDNSFMYDYRKIIIDRLQRFTLEEFKEMFNEYMIEKPKIYSISIDSSIALEKKNEDYNV
jgi:hypothetical protein